MRRRADYVIDRTIRPIRWYRRIDWEVAAIWFIAGTVNALLWALILTLLGVW